MPDSLLDMYDPYQANAARTRRRAPVREPDPLSLYASQGGVSWDKFLPSEQRAMQSAASLQAGGDYNPRDVFLGVIGAAGGAYPVAPKGAAGVFGGRLAKTADQAALAKAEEMAAAGAPREAIWKDTGWFQGADQKWRFEIPDTAAKMNPNTYSGGLPDNGRLQPIAGQMWHPDVYAAYPDVRRAGMLVERQAEPSGVYSSAGASRTGDETLKVFAPTTEDARSVALHEMQHAIQQREGFTPGANPSEILRGYKRIVKDYEDQITAINEQLKRAQGTPRYDELMGMRQELVNEIQKLQGPHGIGLSERAANEYKRDFGEVEARNVQKRRDMTAEERRKLPPWLTEDIPAEKPKLNIGRQKYGDEE